jgi:hypothetical protein
LLDRKIRRFATLRHVDIRDNDGVVGGRSFQFPYSFAERLAER